MLGIRDKAYRNRPLALPNCLKGLWAKCAPCPGVASSMDELGASLAGGVWHSAGSHVRIWWVARQCLVPRSQQPVGRSRQAYQTPSVGLQPATSSAARRLTRFSCFRRSDCAWPTLLGRFAAAVAFQGHAPAVGELIWSACCSGTSTSLLIANTRTVSRALSKRIPTPGDQ